MDCIFLILLLLLDANSDRYSQQDILNLLGAFYAAVFFLGSSNSINVQPVVAVERTVFYRERAAGMYSAWAYAFAQVSQCFLNFIKEIKLNE